MKRRLGTNVRRGHTESEHSSRANRDSGGEGMAVATYRARVSTEHPYSRSDICLAESRYNSLFT